MTEREPPVERSRDEASDAPPPPVSARPPAGGAAGAGAESAAPPGAPSVAAQASRPRRRRGCAVLGLVSLGLLAIAAGYVLWRVVNWPDVAALARRDPTTTAFIERYRARRRAAGEADAVRWQPVSYGRISPHLKRAVLVAEDINFFSHDGFEMVEIRQALRDAWAERRLPRGASTLTQQLAKNLWLSPVRHPLRKLEEALLTRELEATLDKRRILELYLNVAELGPGVYGAEAAARRYFGKPAAALDEREAAGLAASLSRPSSWHPGCQSRGYAKRVDSILRRMAKAGWLWREI